MDFGIGWGRLSRLWIKYLPIANVRGCDSWDVSINHARTSRIPNDIALSDKMLRTLPFAEKTFDLIYAFSIYTHLSEASFLGCLKGSRAMLRDGGQIVFTVRPRNFWHLRPDLPNQNALLSANSFSFVPSAGLTDFGDTSVTYEWLSEALSMSGLALQYIEWSPVDALQIIAVAKRV